MIGMEGDRVSQAKLVISIIKFSDYCLHLYCYFHNVSAYMSSGLLQVFVELGNLHGTSNFIESTGVAYSDSVSHNSEFLALLNLMFPRIQSELSSRTHGVTVIGVGFLSL